MSNDQPGASERHQLLDNLTDGEVEQFLECRAATAMIAVAPEAIKLWGDMIAAIPPSVYEDPKKRPANDELDRHMPGIVFMSLLTETLNVATFLLLQRKFGRELAVRYIKDCWIGKAAETLHEHFPEISVNVVLRDDPHQRPDVPEVPAGGPS